MKLISALLFAGMFAIGGIGPHEVVTGTLLLQTITAAAIGVLVGSGLDALFDRFDRRNAPRGNGGELRSRSPWPKPPTG